MTENKPPGVGLVGAGAFGEFCLAAFADMDEVRIVAVADVNVERANKLAAKFNAVAYVDFADMLADPAVDIVAVNTPPNLHASQGLAAIAASKHVFCEKPLALTLDDGQRIVQAARDRGVRLTVDYVMRHNPFWATAATLARSGVIGPLLHMDLANHAAGLSLPPGHWFWDKRQSGGIWIEHGVHFFDAFAWVSGQRADVVCARAIYRSDGAEERVEGLLNYGETEAHMYHAFNQSGQTEQTTVALTFARGYVVLNEWVPTSLELNTPVGRAAWEEFLPMPMDYATLPDGRTRARAYAPAGKSALYRQSIQAGMRDLARGVRDSEFEPGVTGEDGLESLRVALDAESKGSRKTVRMADGPDLT